MNKKEFRIGNLMQDIYSNIILKVDELTETHIVYYVIDRSKYPLQKGWQAGPIPLTKEILIKAGFEEYENIYELRIGGCCFVFYIYSDAIEFYIEGIGVDVKYVHQLQNLYFALTGKELEINI